VASPDHNGDENPSRLGYFAAIFVSAIGHAAIFFFVFFIAPRYLHPAEAAPPSYTVKIVDNIPAGDLGTHLPRINRHHADESKPAAPKAAEPQVKTEPPKPEKLALNDPNALKINAKPTEAPTETPTPTPAPTIAPTIEPTPEPTVEPGPSLEPNIEATEEPTAAPTIAPTPEPTKQPKKHPTPKATPDRTRNRPKAGSTVAKIAATPSVAERMAKLRQDLLKHYMEDRKNNPPDDEDPDDDTEPTEMADKGPAGGGPVVAPNAIDGKGRGIGTGEGSLGILKDPEFLLYYKTVQDQIKTAWTFTGGSNDLTATVDFAIGPDGTLRGLKIGTSSNDSAFDDSVIRAIRRAAPFPAPPEKFRDQFSAGIRAVFQLGELKKS
jgi:TonB family protein